MIYGYARCSTVTVKKAPTAVSFTSSKVNMIKGETVQFYLRNGFRIRYKLFGSYLMTFDF